VAADGSGLAIVGRLNDCSPELLEQRPGELWQLPETAETVVLARSCRGGRGGWARIDLTTGSVRKLSEVGRLIGTSDPATGIAISADGRQLVYAREDVGHAPELYWASRMPLCAPGASRI